MDSRKRKRLEANGWRVGSTREFLKLSTEEAALVEMKLGLARFVRTARERSHLSQTALADRLGSSQSRVAKLEAGDPTVSLDLMVRAAIVAGAKRAEVARALTAPRRATEADR